MMRRFLIPLDGTIVSEQICEWITELGKALTPRPEIVLFSVVKPPLAELEGTVEVDIEQSPAEVGFAHAPREPVAPPGTAFDLQQQANQLREEGLTVTTQIVAGEDPATEIVRAATDFDVDMIAMATHGGSPLARGILGSVTDRVIRMSERLVLVVRPPSAGEVHLAAQRPTTIIVPLDGKDLSARAVPIAEDFARNLGAKLLFLNVVEGFEKNETGKEHAAADEGELAGALQHQRAVAEGSRVLEPYIGEATRQTLNVEPEVETGNPAKRIIEVTDREKDSWVVMSTHGHTGLIRWLLGGTADKVIRATERPVLVVPLGYKGLRSEV